MSSSLRKRRRTDDEYDEYDEYDDDDWEPNTPTYDTATDRRLREVQEEIKRTEPNIVKILNADILLPDKAELLQLYELYKTMDFSEEQIALKQKIYQKFNDAQKRYRQHHVYSTQEHSRFQKELEQLEKYNEKQEIQYAILSLNTDMHNKSVIYNAHKRLQTLPYDSEEYHKIKHWLNWAISLPYDNYIEFPFNKRELTSFLQNVAQKLDEKLYGMKSVKEQILVFVDNKIRNPHMRKCSLGLIGSPGTGKTRICSLLADILGFPFQQISMGGVNDSTFLKGNRSVYIGSEPGEIVKVLKRMKKKNGIIFLDEYDKIENNDVRSALLHITDSSQNSNYVDTFLSGIKIDLSYIWFVYSMNKLPADDAVADRIFSIQIDGYNRDDKINIIRNYMLKEALKNVNMDEKSVIITDDIAGYIIDTVSHPNEQGVRSIEKAIGSIVNKLSFLKNHQDVKGKLDFDVSFNTNRKIKFPLKLTKPLVESCLTHMSPLSI